MSDEYSTRTCTCCGIEKSLEAFDKKKLCRLGRTRQCRKCSQQKSNAKRRLACRLPYKEFSDFSGGIEIRPIPEWEGYWASNDGNIWSQRMGGHVQDRLHLLKPTQSHRTRLVAVTLCVKKIRRRACVGRLVLEAFIGPKPLGMETCHKDDNQWNNRLENLRWDTHFNNYADAIRNNRMAKGTRQWLAKLTDDAVREIHKAHRLRVIEGGEFMQTVYRELAVKYGVSPLSVRRVMIGETWRHVQD